MDKGGPAGAQSRHFRHDDVHPPGPAPRFASAPTMALRWCARSERGRRPDNEDSYLVGRVHRAFDALGTNVPDSALPRRLEQDGWLLGVADGLGGASAGEVASALALSAGVRFVLSEVRWNFRLGEADLGGLRERAERVFRSIDTEISARASESADLFGMGTTLTAAYVIERLLLLLHVGDSRAYLMRGGRLRRLTHDHTVAQSLADQGAIRQDEVEGHRLRHVLERAMGRDQRELEIEVVVEPLEHGDRLLFSTDGLTEALGDDEIAAILGAHATEERACLELVDRALARGTSDNVTVVVATCAAPGAA
ncbi:MAG: serine/threonine-protein phosphatase [Thermoanaerobaculia bacterium]|nr:MAG: serine/threonine-protein phosphatase [Thermoanaerobaculia bacterium]